MNNKKRISNNKWVIGVGTILIGGFFLDLVHATNFYNAIWNFIKEVFIAIGKFFGKTYPLPLWLIILLPVLLILLILLFAWIVSLFQKTDSPSGTTVNASPSYSFLSYTSDIFDGVLYKWEYVKYSNNPDKYNAINFSIYCPKDNCRLVNQYCPICHQPYLNLKSTLELEALVEHRVNNNLFSKI